MAGAELIREALGELCRRGGWSYAVIWRADRGNPPMLVIEDSYCEEQVRGVIDKMLTQVHRIGEGIVGGAAVNGKCQWMYADGTSGIDLLQTSILSNLDMLQSNTSWQLQLLDGIKTIAIISLPPFAVAQFGSMEKVSENPEFIIEVKQLLLQMGNMSSVLMHGDSHNTNDQHPAVGSLQSEACTENIAHPELLRDSLWSSDYFSQSQGSLNTFGSNCTGRSSIYPHLAALPVISKSIGAIKGFCNSKKLPYHLTDQPRAASSQVQVKVTTSTKPDANLTSNKVSAYLNTIPIGGFTNFPVMEEKLLSGMGVQGYPCFSSTNTELFPSLNEFHQLCGGPSSSNNIYGSWQTTTGARSSELSKACLHGEEKLIGFQNLYRSSSAIGNLSNAQSVGDMSSFVSEIPDSLTFHEAFGPQQSLLLPSEYSPSNFMINQGDQLPENGITDLASQMNETLGVSSVSTGLVKTDGSCCIMSSGLPSKPVECLTAAPVYSLGKGSNENALTSLNQKLADNASYDATVLDMSIEALMQEWWEDTVMPVGNVICSNLSGSASCISQLENGSISGVGKELLPKSSFEQLLNAIVGDNNKASACGSTNLNHIAGLDKEHQLSTIATLAHPSAHHNQIPLVSFPSISHTSDKVTYESSREGPSKSHVSPWIEDSCSMNNNAVKINQPKKPEEAVKVVKKRARPGESTRPRPRDRQQIQDRVKELREIVPDGAKCSIDALLDRTIKHMHFLQSVTKYADKIKQANEPKMIGEESGVVLKENSGGGRGGGTTWAYEVSGQTMVCPIIIEDLTPPGQMLVEMLCEERGFFLEIADVIRGFGLIILKGVMEIRDSKIWARFLVEANRDVTRMDIFLSLIQLLQQTSAVRSSDLLTKVIDKGAATFKDYQQSPISIPVGLADRMQ
ncbi:transcription factor EMB1444-like [Typha latifolia]|uniref:transcription factor EMB1444-like n=1 Tax=Typha latifolia TaxID=4733 RepID=UPI003C2C54C7